MKTPIDALVSIMGCICSVFLGIISKITLNHAVAFFAIAASLSTILFNWFKYQQSKNQKS